MTNTFELRKAAKSVHLVTDELTADLLSKMLNSAADRIDELEKKETKVKINNIDLCPDCGKPLKAKTWAEGGGVECTNPECSYWFCY